MADHGANTRDHIIAALQAHGRQLANSSLAAHFEGDTERCARFVLTLDDLLVDLSRQNWTGQTLDLLLQLAGQSGLARRRAGMFDGAPVNLSEKRAVLHIALRCADDAYIAVDGHNVVPDVVAAREKLLAMAEDLRSGAVRGASGEVFRDVVNIGIGGSDLGPRMAVRALRPFHDGPNVHFLSNVDGAHSHDILSGLDPARTLFIVASKTFTTSETMTNAGTCRRFVAQALGDAAVARHFIGLTSAVEKAAAFGIAGERILGFWDWVGGRYSLWSAIGLPLALAIGAQNFKKFLDGARAMDAHFAGAPMARNMPVMMGLCGYWNRSILGHQTRAILPYDQRLRHLPAYLQQLDMESNGKSVSRDGNARVPVSGPIVWGAPGTDGQHAFHQLLHQGSIVAPAEFIIAARGHERGHAIHHKLLLANFLAQSRALAIGRDRREVEARLRRSGMSAQEVQRLVPHRVFEGNRPSTSIVYEKLTPYALGRLIALYEHRVFVEGVLWDINSFDQWGVELGKELAVALLPALEGRASSDDLDPSTRGLIEWLRSHGAGG